uniref:Transmembrane protein 198 n=1 Tax=Prolemur simus TaxID=1328070 RepID=A0A8C8YHP4_PROSS
MEEALLPLAVMSDSRPFNQQLPEPPEPSCVLEPQENPELAPALVCALCCCFGIIYCCFGYRCFKAVMFLSGLLSGALVIFLLCHKERVLETQLSLEVRWDSWSKEASLSLYCSLSSSGLEPPAEASPTPSDPSTRGQVAPDTLWGGAL